MSFLDFFTKGLTKTKVGQKSFDNAGEAVLELAKQMSAIAPTSTADAGDAGITFNQPTAQPQPQMTTPSFNQARFGTGGLTKKGTILNLLLTSGLSGLAAESSREAHAASFARGGPGSDSVAVGFNAAEAQRQAWEEQQKFADWQQAQPARDAFAQARIDETNSATTRNNRVMTRQGLAERQADGSWRIIPGTEPDAPMSEAEKENARFLARAEQARNAGLDEAETKKYVFGITPPAESPYRDWRAQNPNAPVTDFYAKRRKGGDGSGARRGTPGQFSAVETRHGDEITDAETRYSQTIGRLKAPKLVEPNASDTEKAQFERDSQAYEDAKSRALDTLNAEKQRIEDNYADRVNSLGGTAQRFRYLNLGAAKSKPITKDIASDFLRRAGGDKDKARQMARAAGYEF